MRNVGLVLSLVLFALGASAQQTKPPNILIILADDLGIECLSAYGGRSHKTPNIDKLAKDGVRFTHCFSNPTCSPSRATLLTGRYSFKHGLKFVIWHEQKHANHFLTVDQPSFTHQVKKLAGYSTAIAGKWQLSFLNQRNTINQFDFDQYQCWQIHDSLGARTTRYREPYFNRNGQLIFRQITKRYGPDVNVEFLSKFIKENAAKKKPFLAYYTSLLPHYPWVPTPDSKDQNYTLPNNKHKGDPKYFPDMVAYLDKMVGRLLKTLDEAGVADNTMVIFMADNGTDRDLKNKWGPKGVMVAGGKGTLTDRGTRVPLIIRWPGKVKPGTTRNDLVDFTDIFPTVCRAAGVKVPAAPIHGRRLFRDHPNERRSPRSWVHIQDRDKRYLRSNEYILTNRGEFRRVVGIADPPAKPIKGKLTEQQQRAKQKLQAAFEALDK